jgi:hypothetical protein
MGCSNSKELKDVDSPAIKYKADQTKDTAKAAPFVPEPQTGLTAFLPRTGPMSATEYQERLESSETSTTVELPHSNFSIKYAWVSQRGYYPSDPSKPNQDAYCAHPRFNNNREDHLFGVFDGHGEFGTETAFYARDKASPRAPARAQGCWAPRAAGLRRRRRLARQRRRSGPAWPKQPPACLPAAAPPACPPAAAATCSRKVQRSPRRPAPAPALPAPCTQIPENIKANPHLGTSPALAFHQAMVRAWRLAGPWWLGPGAWPAWQPGWRLLAALPLAGCRCLLLAGGRWLALAAGCRWLTAAG